MRTYVLFFCINSHVETIIRNTERRNTNYALYIMVFSFLVFNEIIIIILCILYFLLCKLVRCIKLNSLEYNMASKRELNMWEDEKNTH